jgi:Spy/CpxP family protein refolding chaperone
MMWNAMTPEQKEKFKEEWKNRRHRWGYRSWRSEDETQQPESQV